MRNASRVLVLRCHITSIARLCVTALLFLLSTTLLGAAEFVPLGDLPGGEFFSRGVAVSEDGQVVFGRGTSDANDAGIQNEGFRWTSASGAVGLGFSVASPESDMILKGASGDGAIAVASSGGAAQKWTESSGWVDLNSLSNSLPPMLTTQGISQDGSKVIGETGLISTTDGNIPLGYIWDDQTGMTILGGSNVPLGISKNGEFVVGSTDQESGAGAEPYLWSSTTGVVGLGSNGFDFGLARGVSADGSIVVARLINDTEGSFGAIWRNGTGWDLLGEMAGGGRATEPYDVSNDGTVATGTGQNGSGEPTAFLWTESDGVRSLQDVLVDDLGLQQQLVGWNLLSGFDISGNGRFITGIGFNPNGEREGFLVDLGDPVPEPSTAALFALAFIVNFIRRYPS